MYDLATIRRAGCLPQTVEAASTGQTLPGAQCVTDLFRVLAVTYDSGQTSRDTCVAPVQNPNTLSPAESTSAPGTSVSPVRGIVFDMGDVLYDATLWRRWLYQLLVRMGLQSPYRTLYRVWQTDFLPDIHRGRRTFADAFHVFLLSLGLSRGQVDEVEAASQSRKRELELDVRPLPGVRDTIQRLVAQGVQLAVLNNSEQSGDELQNQLGRLGLGECFSPVISSLDLKYTKPSPVCYRAALAHMNLPADAVAFVGHDGTELVGAHAVGMRTVAFNYETGVSADYYLTRFEELLHVVG